MKHDSFLGCIAVLNRCSLLLQEHHSLSVGNLFWLHDCDDREPCKNGWTDWDAIWVV